MTSSSYSTAILLFCLFSLASATGHLRLELTSSTEITLHLKTDSSFQTILLSLGTTRIVSFHPRIHQENLEITFFMKGSAPETQVYQMKKTESPLLETLVFSDAVILVQSHFECDAGFFGDLCLDRTTSTSPTTTATTPATTVTTTTGASAVTDAPISQTMVPTFMNIILCGSLIMIIVVLITIYSAIRQRQQHIYIQPEFPTPPKKCKITIEDSGRQSPGSVRYTAAPFHSVTISL